MRAPRTAATPADTGVPDPAGRSDGTTPVQIFQASTLYGAATLAAALDAGRFGPADRARRVLLLTNNAAVPEVAPHMSDMTGFQEIAARFDQVEDWNEAIAPHHPGGWQPRPDDVPLWERVLRTRWRLGTGPVTLVVESIQVSPARSLAAVFAGAPVHVYADGLMSYGPTRDEPPHSIAVRVQRLLHLDLVPGLRPLLLSEFGVEAELVPDDAFRAVLSELSRAASGDAEVARAAEAAPTALLLGQYLAALDILTAEEEEDLHVRMLRAAAEAGHRSVAFKPHPTAPVRYGEALRREADKAGVRLTELGGALLAEVFYDHLPLELVVGCFSTALLTAAVYHGIPTARVGTGTVLRRLAPYENSNRVPLVIVDRVVPGLEAGAAPRPPEDPATLQPLLEAVGYGMQPTRYPWLRPRAVRVLSQVAGDAGAGQAGPCAAYFDTERLTELELPGGSKRRAPLRQVLPRGLREAASRS
ncbi:polysialyltransferase family glycosyltransferase [Streptomyces sp. Tu 6176]|uniref:polysialyltransferase family glycosyltransferase n=1 Tax=Streptomyces sp. Tu 6176 TaxID=1470557 RepID=UPI003B63290B